MHYVSIRANLTNIEEMVLWAENNPIVVQKITRCSTLSIYDLLFHPNACRYEDFILECAI